MLSASATDGRDIEVPWEQVAKLVDADVIGLPTKNDGSPDPDTTRIRRHRMFRLLPAPLAGRVRMFAHFTPGSYRSAIGLLDELDDALASLA